jgi:tetratricopeptide (TPR) repeat protein
MTGDDALEAAIDDLVHRGCDLADAGDHAGAAALFRRAAEQGSALAWFNLGNSLRALHRWEDAVRAHEQAAALGEVDAWLNLALVLLDLHRWPEAERAARRAIALGDTAGWGPLGSALEEQGRRGEAVSAFRLGAERGDLAAAVQLAWALHEDGEDTAAQAWMRRAAEGGDAQARAVLACWRWDATTDAALEDELRAGAEVYPPARVDLAHLLRATGRVEEARSTLEAGALRNEEDTWLPLGNLLLDEFQQEVAAAAAYRAGIDAGDLHCHHNLGVLLLAQGDVDGAVEQLLLGAEGGDELAARVLREVLEEE